MQGPWYCLQASSRHGEDVQQWGTVARKLEQQELPRVKRWDHIFKILHEELRMETEQLHTFSSKFDAPGTTGAGMSAAASMA